MLWAGRELSRVRLLKKGFKACGAISMRENIIIGPKMFVGNQRIQFTPSLRVLVKSELSGVRSPTDTTYHHRFFIQYHGSLLSLGGYDRGLDGLISRPPSP